jgi:hypothetical protein
MLIDGKADDGREKTNGSNNTNWERPKHKSNNARNDDKEIDVLARFGPGEQRALIGHALH